MKRNQAYTIDDAIQITEKALCMLNELKSGNNNVKFAKIAHVVECWSDNRAHKNEKQVTITYGKNSCIYIEHTISEEDENFEQEGGAL